MVSMRILHAAGVAVALLLLAACAPRRPEPAPVPAPQPAPPPPPPSAPLDWQDAPLSPGDWSYRDLAGMASASFVATNSATVTFTCLEDRQIHISVLAGGRAPSIVVRTSFGERRLPASPDHASVYARLPADDPLLDQIAFSRGRFLVQAEGAPPTILPAWPEPARVIEDCRG